MGNNWKLIMIILGFGIVLIGCREPSNSYEVVSSISTKGSEGMERSQLTVLVDNEEGKTKEEIAEAILDKYINNTFKEMMFRTDLSGYTEILVVNVEVSKMLSKDNLDSFTAEFKKVSESPIEYFMEIE